MFLGVTFVIFTDSLDGRGKGEVDIVDEDVGSIRIVLNVDGMETFGSGSKFEHTSFGEDLEDATAVRTVVGDFELLPQMVKRADIGDAPGVKVNRRHCQVRRPWHGFARAGSSKGIRWRGVLFDCNSCTPR